MKKGVGCRIGGVAVRRVIIRVTPQGPTIDATYNLIDPETQGVKAVTRKVRDWPITVQKKLVELIEALEEAEIPSIFLENADATETSILDHLTLTEDLLKNSY